MSQRQLVGWLCFTASGVFILIIGIQNRDWLTLASAVLWLVGCGLFLSDRE